MRRLKLAEKLAKDRLIEGEMACESHMIEAMVRGYQNSLRFRSLTSLLRLIADSMDDDGTKMVLYHLPMLSYQ